MSQPSDDVLPAHRGFVRCIPGHPLVPEAMPVHGGIDDVETGRLDGAAIGGAAR